MELPDTFLRSAKWSAARRGLFVPSTCSGAVVVRCKDSYILNSERAVAAKTGVPQFSSELSTSSMDIEE